MGTTLKNYNPALSPTIDQVGVEERCARFQSRSIKDATKTAGLKLAMSMIDLTTLEGKDSEGKVKQLCYKAMHPHDAFPGIPQVAAICVYPTMVKTARQALKGSNIHVASVATAFPSGLAPLKVKLEDTRFAVNEGADEIDMVISRGKFLQGEFNFVFDEIAAIKEACGKAHLKVKLEDTRFAVNEGADEIDMVISRGKFLQGEFNFVFDEIAAIKEACGKAHLKVILETGELSTLDNVRKASDLAILAGADFIKTSTGKIQPAATMPVTLVMLEAIRDYYYATGKMIGMKPAGGIANSKLALHYLVMVNETLGAAWLNPDWFRFGASKLANDIIMQLVKQETSVYQSLNYFSND
jgi:deoxyribose-phosphate aldolase